GPRPHEGHVAADAGHEDVRNATDVPRLVAAGDVGVRSGGGEEAADAGAAGAQRLGQRPLRQELEGDGARLGGRDRLGVAGEEAADRLRDLAVAQQTTTAEAGLADVVRDVRQVPGAGLRQRVGEVHRVAGHAEPAHQQRVAVLYQGGGLL